MPASAEWGDPLASEEFIEVEARIHRNDRFAAHVAGTSCYPFLQPGDLTVWQVDLNPPYGMIVLAQNKGEHGCTVKELAWDRDTNSNILIPLNPLEVAPPPGDGWGAIARLVYVESVIDGLTQSWYVPTGLRKHHLAQRMTP